MSVVYGTDYQINVKNDTVYEPLGGTVYEPVLDPNASIVTEVGCGEGARTIAAQKIVSAKPALRWTMNLRKLVDYITTKAMITAEGAVPAHDLTVKIGSEYHILGGCKVNTCRITIRQLESIKAALEVFAKTRTEGSSWTFEKATDDAMWKDALTTLTLGSTPITKWREVEFGVDNKVAQEILGVDILPTEVHEREAAYTGHIIRAVAGATEVADVLAGTPKDVVITLTDNQTTPVAKTFTFAGAYLKTSRISVRGLEMIVERIDWEAKTMVIT